MIPVDLLIERGATYRKINTGEYIFNEGGLAAYYYQLVSGQVRWCTLMDDGREVLHKIIEPGEGLGELPLFDGSEYAASAIADSPCVLLRLCSDTFLELLREFPDLHFTFTQSLVSNLRFKFMLTNGVGYSPEHVLQNLIQYLNKHGKFICKDCNRLMLTRQQLANMTGLRVETIIRTIKNMEKEERLSIVRGKVFIPSDGLG